MDSDNLQGFAWIIAALFVFTMLDLDVVAKQVRKRFFSDPNQSA